MTEDETLHVRSLSTFTFSYVHVCTQKRAITVIYMDIYNHRSRHTYVHASTWSYTFLFEVTGFGIFKLARTCTHAYVHSHLHKHTVPQYTHVHTHYTDT